MNDSQSLLVSLLDIVPVGWNPRRVLIFPFHRQAAARSLEAPLSARTAHQLLATSSCNGGLEQNLPALLVPEPMVCHADDQVRNVRRFSRALVEECLQAIPGHAELRLHLVQNTEVVVVDHAVDVTLIAKLRRFREQHDTQYCRDHESRNQHPDGPAAVRKNSHCHVLPRLAAPTESVATIA